MAVTESWPPVQIHIMRPEDEGYGDLPNVGLANIGGERHLFLKPQRFDSAVRQVSSAMPDLPLEHVERLLCEHPEDFKDFDELLGSVEPAPPLDITPLPDEPIESASPHGRAKRWMVAAALVLALAGSWALGYFTAGSPAGTAASPSGVQPAAKPFVGPEFLDFSKAGQIDCKPIANLEAECTDADGMVMASKAATGPDSTIFTFSYGSERIGLRIFGDAHYAETWARQDGTTELYPNLSRSGRYVLWGTDEQRLSEYADLLHAEETRQLSTASKISTLTPLPPRLAALTLGTLGLDTRDVETILSAPNSAPAAESDLLAAQAVLGVRTTVPWFTGGDDLVAIAAGLDRPPVLSPPEHTADMDPPVVPIADEGTPSTPTTSPAGTPPTTTSPAPAPKPDAEAPRTEQPASAPAPVEPAAPEQPSPPQTLPPEQATPPASDPVEEAPAAVETPAAGEAPTDEGSEPVEGSAPVAETPAPADLPADTAAPAEESTSAGSADPGTGQAGDDLLILDSAWTVAAA